MKAKIYRRKECANLIKIANLVPEFGGKVINAGETTPRGKFGVIVRVWRRDNTGRKSYAYRVAY